jgi:hypothetical protein
MNTRLNKVCSDLSADERRQQIRKGNPQSVSGVAQENYP